jgi:hypothetical protein
MDLGWRLTFLRREIVQAHHEICSAPPTSQDCALSHTGTTRFDRAMSWLQVQRRCNYAWMGIAEQNVHIDIGVFVSDEKHIKLEYEWTNKSGTFVALLEGTVRRHPLFVLLGSVFNA